MYFVLFVVSSIAAGMVLYDEYNWFDAVRCVGFFVGLAVTFFGVYLVGKKDGQSQHSSREQLLGNGNEVSIAEFTDESDGPLGDERPRRCLLFWHSVAFSHTCARCSSSAPPEVEHRRASVDSTGSNESIGSMKDFLVAVAKHVATPAKVVGKGIASNMVKAGATALAMGGAPLKYHTQSTSGHASSPPKK